MATQPANRNSLQPSKASIALIRYLHPASTTLSQTSPDLLSTKNMNIPPIIPQDRSGTSMRMLIHDTQAMFEKYSGCANDLLKGVGEAKRTMIVAQKLFEEDHEKIVGQTVDLANRCQVEVQKTLGTPAQAQKLEDLHQESRLALTKIDSLEKRQEDFQSIVVRDLGIIMQQLTRSDERYERIEKSMPPIVQAAIVVEQFSGKLETITQNLIAAALEIDKLKALSSSDSDAAPDSNLHFAPIVLQAVSAPSPKTKKRKPNTRQFQTDRELRARPSASAGRSNSQLSNSISQSFEVYQDADPSAGLTAPSMPDSNSAFQKPAPEPQISSASRHPSVSRPPVFPPILPSSLLEAHNSSRKCQQVPQTEPMNQQNQHSTQEHETTIMRPPSSRQQSAKPKLQSGDSLPSSSTSIPRRFDSRHVITAHPERPSSSSGLPQTVGGRIHGSSDASARPWATVAGTEESDSQPAATATAAATPGAMAPACDLLASVGSNRTRNVVEATRAPGNRKRNLEHYLNSQDSDET